MGSKPSKQHKALSPLSSWGGSFDDLICGEGKICADRWTPTVSREGSPVPRSFRRTRSAATSRRSSRRFTRDYDDDIEVIRQQPLPLDTYTMRAPMEILEFDRPYTSMSHRHYTPQHSLLSPRPAKVKRKRKKKKIQAEEKTAYPSAPIQIFIDTKKVLEIDPRRQSRSRNVIHLNEISTQRREEHSLKAIPDRHRSFSEPQNHRRKVHPHISRSRMKSVPVAYRRTLSTFVATTIGSDNPSLLRSTRRVVPPRHLRPYPIQPPQPFRIRAVSDQPYHRIKTASHPYL